MAKLFNLAARTALVTGSSRGLGRAIATGLAEAGAAVVLNGADAGRLASATATDCAGGALFTSHIDRVTNEAEISRLPSPMRRASPSTSW
jgi:gluconate 5-dehydrogenase